MADAVLVGVHSTKTVNKVRPGVVSHNFQLKTVDKPRGAVNITFNPEVNSTGNNQPTDTQYWTDS